MFDASAPLQTAFDLEAVFTLLGGMNFQVAILANQSDYGMYPPGVLIDVNVSTVDARSGVRKVVVTAGVPRGGNAKLNVTSEFEYAEAEVTLPLRVLVDRSIIEIFVGNGE